MPLGGLIKCGYASVVKISYTLDLYKRKVVLLGGLPMEEGCYQDFKPPWHTCESGLLHGGPWHNTDTESQQGSGTC